MRKLSSILLFILLAAATVALWRSQVNHEYEMILRHVESSAEIARIRTGNIVESRTAALELLADRWVDKNPPDFSRQRFLSFADAVFTRYPAFSGIYWADTEGIIRFVFPLGAESLESGKRIQNTPGLAVSKCYELPAGKKGFQIVLPLLFEGKLQGYLAGEFEVARIMDFALPASVMKDYVVDLYEGDRIIFHAGQEISTGYKIYAKRTIDVGGRKWRLEMKPGPGVYSTGSNWIFLFMVFGIILSASLSLLFYLLLHRMEAYKISRDLALNEVNERKRVEVVLQAKEKELKELVSELSSKNAELESFIYTISHDLKTPIVTIGGFIGALREDFGTVIPREADGYLDYMSAAGRKMESLINDLLDLSRVGRLVGKRTMVRFDEIVEDALVTLRPNIEARGIQLNVQENLPEVYCEKKRLGQVVYNLLSNAIKYIGKDNKAPRIDIGAEQAGGQWVFYVRDNGIGIDEKFFEKIFHIFERLPSAKKEEGTGIGLTIVKRIIEYHGGDVWVTSQTGHGSTFFFKIDDRES